MTTFNADQLNPPDNTEPERVTPPTDAERAAATARVEGTAVPVTGAVTPPPAPEPIPPSTGPSDAAFEAGTDTAADQSTTPPDPGTDVDVVVPDEADSGNVIALAERFDVTLAGETWPHDMLEFKGDLLGIRLPARQALAAFSLASSKYVSLSVKNDLTGLFIARHLSPESYGRVFSRLMDPDEDDYDVDTVGELFNAIVTAAVDADKAADAAKPKGDDAK